MAEPTKQEVEQAETWRQNNVVPGRHASEELAACHVHASTEERKQEGDVLTKILDYLDEQTPEDTDGTHWAAIAYQKIGAKFIAGRDMTTKGAEKAAAREEKVKRLMEDMREILSTTSCDNYHHAKREQHRDFLCPVRKRYECDLRGLEEKA